MKIANEKKLSKIIHLYSGLNFKTKFNLTTEQYKYLRKKYKVSKLASRSERICWKCDNNFVSCSILNTNLCSDCYKQSAYSYKKFYKIPDSSLSIINKICMKRLYEIIK